MRAAVWDTRFAFAPRSLCYTHITIEQDDHHAKKADKLVGLVQRTANESG